MRALIKTVMTVSPSITSNRMDRLKPMGKSIDLSQSPSAPPRMSRFFTVNWTTNAKQSVITAK